MAIKRVLIISFATLAGLIGSLIAFPQLLSFNRQDRAENLVDTATQSIKHQNDIYDRLASIQRHTRLTFQQHYMRLSDEEVETQFENLFPIHASGTRRSHPDHFENSGQASDIYGMGVFIAKVEPSLIDKRAAVSGFLAISEHGPKQYPNFDNLYFNNDGDMLIIFGPDRDDKLLFYRDTASANFNFFDELFVKTAKPANNPLGETRCLSLTKLIHDMNELAAQTTGCHTPVRVNSTHIGGIGITLDVSHFIKDTIRMGIEYDHEAMLFTNEGDLIAHPEFYELDRITSDIIERVNAEHELEQIGTRLAREGRHKGWFNLAGGDSFIAFSQIDMPGWYFAIKMTYPNLVWISVLQSFLIGLVISGTTLVLIFMARVNTKEFESYGAIQSGLKKAPPYR